MSKILEHAAYLTPNAEYPGEYDFTIKVRLKEAVIEQGAFEAVAMGKGWGGDVPAPQFLIDWVKKDAQETLLRIAMAQAAAAAAEARRLELIGNL
jgi:hypothetical protein